MDLVNSLHIAASGMKAQSQRLRVVAENIANADSIGKNPGDAPYRRKTISFDSVMDREGGFDRVEAGRIRTDKSEFRQKYDPNHPMANGQGYVLYPNVNSMVEMVDMRESRRGYEANINVVEVSKSMLMQTINLLKN